MVFCFDSLEQFLILITKTHSYNVLFFHSAQLYHTTGVMQVCMPCNIGLRFIFYLHQNSHQTLGGTAFFRDLSQYLPTILVLRSFSIIIVLLFIIVCKILSSLMLRRFLNFSLFLCRYCICTFASLQLYSARISI